MTVKTQVKKVTGVGNGSGTTFSFFPMVIFASTDLQVTHVDENVSPAVETLLTEGAGPTNYSVTVSEFPGTGSAVYPADQVTPMPVGEKIVIKRELSITQLINLLNNDDYFADVQEEMVDRLTMICLQLEEELERTVRVTIGSDTDPEDLLAEIDQAVADSAASAAAAATSETNAAISEAAAAVSAAAAQAAVNGLKWKPSAKAASVGNLVLSGAQTVDTIALIAGDICLAKDQTAPAENGLYTVAAGAWSRILEMDDWEEVPSAATTVEEGSTANADTIFLCISDQGGTIDVTAIAWTVYGNVSATSTTTFTNKTFDANAAGNDLSNVGVADLADGTDGELITWSPAGEPATVGAGTSGQILNSNGPGTAPTFEDPPGPVGETAKMWVNFNGTGAIAINDSFNVASLTDNGTGDYTINFTTNFTDANYCTVVSAGQQGSAAGVANATQYASAASNVSVAVTSAAHVVIDRERVMAASFGDLV